MTKMLIDRSTVEQALEALQNCANGEDDVLLTRDALAALRAALAEPVQEPVAFSVGRTLHWHEGKGVSDAQLFAAPPQRPAEPVQEPVAVFDEQQGSPVLLASAPMLSDGQPLYTHPPRREWRSLSEDELTALGIIHSRYQEESLETGGWFDFARAVEAALKEKNHE